MFSFSRNELPSVFLSYCQKPSHRYSTRFSKLNFSIPSHQTKLSETSIKVIGPKIWAEISPELKIFQFRKSFSDRLKQGFLDELPKLKRTKNIDFNKDTTNNSFFEIFNDSGNDASFYGFEAFEI